MTILEIEGQRVEVDDSFTSLSPQQQAQTVEEIAAKIGVKPSGGGIQNNGFLGQANRAIGDAVDFVNPFDNEAWGNIAGGRLQTPSASDAMRGAGVAVANQAPQTVMQAAGRGFGNAATALAPAAGALNVARGMGGVAGGVADDAFRSMASRGGATAELAAGSVGGAAGQAAEQAGYPDWVQNTAEIAAPGLAIPAAGAALRGGARGGMALAERTPVTGAAIRGAREVKRGLFPMTEGGAREQARNRLQTLAGGEDRAAELGRTIEIDNDMGLTPAQQTGDQNLLGLERSAAEESPELRERLKARAERSRTAGEGAIAGMGGNTEDARRFFDRRVRDFQTDMRGRIDTARRMGDESVEGVAPTQSESSSSIGLTNNIKRELDASLMEERRLWESVPKDETFGTYHTQGVVDRLIGDTPWAQRNDIPDDLRAAFGPNGAIGNVNSVREIYGLYSEMRRISRSAMAGTNQNKNTARIANTVADAILKDLGANIGDTPAGAAINEARAYSRALHETFDQGAVGRILKRTIDGDETMTPEASLSRTVGRGGSEGLAASRQIRQAAPGAMGDVQDYLRGGFMDSVRSPDGSFSATRAQQWMRKNRELLAEQPELLGEFRKALKSREAAAAFEVRTEARTKLAQGSSQARFTDGQTGKAVLSILGADNPAQTARSLANTARKDPSGKALAGLKGSFSDYLIGQATRGEGGMSGLKLQGVLADPNLSSAVRQVFDAGEIERMGRVASELSKVDRAATGETAGDVINSPANKLLETVVRVAAAQHGGRLGGGSMGGSLQTANIFSERAKKMLRNLTNDKARQLLMDAIEDPVLFRTLLMEPPRIELNAEARNRLAPYLTGAAATQMDQEQE